MVGRSRTLMNLLLGLIRRLTAIISGAGDQNRRGCDAAGPSRIGHDTFGRFPSPDGDVEITLVTSDVDEGWTAAIYVGDHPSPVGCGILLDDRRVLTAAHVANMEGKARLSVRFPKSPINSEQIQISAVHTPNNGYADVAMLILEESPANVVPAPVRVLSAAELRGLRWLAFGFSDRFGAEASGVIGAALADGHVRLDTESRQAVAQGFSGAAVWSPDHGAVVGMVTAAAVAGESRGDAVAIALATVDAAMPDEHVRDLVYLPRPTVDKLPLSAGDDLQILLTLSTDRPLTSLTFGALDGNDLVLAGCEDGSVRTWNLAVEPPAERSLYGHDGAVWAVAAAAVGDRLIAVSAGQDSTVRRWDVGAGVSVDQPLAGHTAPVNAVATAVIGDRHIVASAGDDFTIRVRDIVDGDEVAVLQGHTDWVNALAVSQIADGSWILVSGSSDRTVRIWDLVSGVMRHALPAHSGEVSSVSIASTANGAIMVSGGNDEAVHLWDAITGHLLQSMHGHSGRVRAVALGAFDGQLLAASAGDDHTVRVWDPYVPDPQPLVLSEHAQAVRALAFTTLWGRDILVSCSDDGTVRFRGSSAQHSSSDRLDWLSDSPATVDLLQRGPLAHSLATRLERVRHEAPDVSFLIHIDGPWGAGKSTLIGLLQKELTENWTVVGFNAWRESRVGPSWWALLAALRRDMGRDRGVFGRLWLRAAETWSRLRRAGAPAQTAALAFLVAASGGYLFLRLTHMSWKDAGEALKTLSAAVTALGAVWAAALLAIRLLLWDSAKGARKFMQSNTDPMQQVADHFEWLLSKARRPVVFIIDDLDRCPQAYVVELLEAIQTLLRDTADGRSAANFIVAADGAWIRRSYEIAYDQFAESVAEPGRPLGYLFLDKLFQLRVPIPSLDTVKQDEYLRGLLRLGTSGGVRSFLAAEERAVRTALRQSTTEAQVVAALQTASPIVRGRVAAAAVIALAEPNVAAATEHSLQRFGPLLPPNPRSMKRFLNTYTALRAVRTLEGNAVPSEPLALWAIIEIRWPSLADHLRVVPDHINHLVGPADPLDGVPAHLRGLFTDANARRLAAFEHGGPLTVGLVSACCGTQAYKPEGDRPGTAR